MKKLLLPFILLLSVVFITSCNKESASVKVKKENLETAKKRDVQISKGAAEIKFDITEYDFGAVNEGEIVEAKYMVTNAGKTDLIISNVQASCGCTVPNWPKEPILPGKSGEIEVVFRPSKGQAGSKQTKTVTVSANTSPENTILKITAFVNKTAE